MEMLDAKHVSIHCAITSLSIERVKIQPVSARYQRQRHRYVPPKLIRRSSLARIVAGDRQPTAQFASRVLKSAHVVALPAME